MNLITKNQNQPLQLKHLTAQRLLYSSAKRYYWVQIIGSVFLPSILTLISLYAPLLSGYAALYGLCFLIIDQWLIENEVMMRKSKAAQIQEMFDCFVLDIPTSLIPMTERITIEEVLENHRQNDQDNLKNWYPTEVTKFKLPIARLLCQRTNVYWDSKIRKYYSNYLRLLLLIVVLIILIIGISYQMQFENIVLILSTLSPFIRFSIKEYYSNKESNKRLRYLIEFFSNIWKTIKENKIDDVSLLSYSRKIQDELFIHRSQSPMIPNFIYKLTREKTENTIKETIETFADDLLHL